MAFIVHCGLEGGGGEGCLRSPSPTATLCVTHSGALLPARPPQPSWAHLRKVGMSLTGTLRVSALTRRLRSSVSRTTSRSSRMGSSGWKKTTERSECRSCALEPCCPHVCSAPPNPAASRCSWLPAARCRFPPWLGDNTSFRRPSATPLLWFGDNLCALPVPCRRNPTAQSREVLSAGNRRCLRLTQARKTACDPGSSRKLVLLFWRSHYKI